VQDVEDAVEVFGLFDGGDVGGFLNHADHALVAGCAGAVEARVDVGDVVADGAETEVGFDVTHGGREGLGIFFAGAKNVKGQPLRAFGADARKFFQFVNQPRHRFGKFGHKN
jgi:hypothetical protein